MSKAAFILSSGQTALFFTILISSTCNHLIPPKQTLGHYPSIPSPSPPPNLASHPSFTISTLYISLELPPLSSKPAAISKSRPPFGTLQYPSLASCLVLILPMHLLPWRAGVILGNYSNQIISYPAWNPAMILHWLQDKTQTSGQPYILSSALPLPCIGDISCPLFSAIHIFLIPCPQIWAKFPSTCSQSVPVLLLQHIYSVAL